MAFRAVVASGKGEGCVVQTFDGVEDLPRQDKRGDVTVQVSYSCLNYKVGPLIMPFVLRLCSSSSSCLP